MREEMAQQQQQPRILLTGSVGYIGCCILERLAKTHPELPVTAIPRDAPCEYDVIQEHAAKSDIVIHAGKPEAEKVILSLLHGLASRDQSKPSFFLHLSSNITVSDATASSTSGNEYNCCASAGIEFGERDPRVWSDIDDLPEIRTLPNNHIHRPMDSLIFGAAKKYGENIHTAIVCPPDIYGTGAGGLERKRECRMLPLYCDEVSRQKAALYVGKGANMRSLVHVHDLCELYRLLVEEAVRTIKTGKLRDECWGENGFYFVSNDEDVSMRDIAKAAAGILKSHGLIQNENPRSCTPEETENMIDGSGIALWMFGSNSRTNAARAKKLLGWVPKGPYFWEVFENDLIQYKGNDPYRDFYPENMEPEA